MRYYSTNQQAPLASLEKAVVKGLAEDKGLYMPERIRQLSDLPFGGVAVLGALWGSAPSLDTAESIIRQYKRMAYELTR